MPILEIRLLLPGDKRDDFLSAEEALDQYFRVYAGQNQFRHRIGVNYVAIVEGRVIGYAGVSRPISRWSDCPRPWESGFRDTRFRCCVWRASQRTGVSAAKASDWNCYGTYLD